MQDSCRQAFQSEKMLALAAAEKRYSAEIQKVRLEERKKAELEMNALRDSFVKREQETVEDLHSLEKLHQEQYQRLVRTYEVRAVNMCVAFTISLTHSFTYTGK